MSAPIPETAENSDRARTSLEALRTEISKAVVGQDPAVTGLVVALFWPRPCPPRRSPRRRQDSPGPHPRRIPRT
jgi:hypothetical protein